MGMFKITASLFTLLLVNLSANSDLIQRRWSVPKMTPVIEIWDSSDGPFAEAPLITIETFTAEEIQKWLISNGVSFPPGSSASYSDHQKKGAVLVVKNTPTNLEIIDGVLTKAYPVHATRSLLEKIITNIEGKGLEETITILRGYPTQILGPIGSVISELGKLDQKLSYDLDDTLKIIVTNRRNHILKTLPESLKTTRTYYLALVKSMNG
jgi:hypothetical protein